MDSLEKINPYLSEQNNSQNFTYMSPIPEICKNEECILGVDEAGRGPVLGPMVYGIAYIPKSKAEVLKTNGCVDSKVLDEAKRDVVFSKICNTCDCLGWAVEVVSPNIICQSMLSRTKRSLNVVSMDSAIDLIKNALAAEVNVTEVYVDTVGPPEKYQAYLSDIFPNIKITVAKKADSTYPIVSAASICAKVTRDHMLQVWKFREGLEATNKDFGSGYPGDPVTKKFILNNIDQVFGFPQLVRFSWSTADKLLDEKACRVDWSDDENEKSNPKSRKITTLFPVNGVKKPKHLFFSQRNLKNTSTICE